MNCPKCGTAMERKGQKDSGGGRLVRDFACPTCGQTMRDVPVLTRTMEARCPHCGSPKVGNVPVATTDATFGEHPKVVPLGPEEVWKCQACDEDFIKVPAPSK